MELAGLSDDELLSRRNQAFLRVAATKGSGSRRRRAYDDIRLINRELKRRRRSSAGGGEPDQRGRPARPASAAGSDSGVR